MMISQNYSNSCDHL